jgi:tRNA nucleotidyltransferase (CCA-adding enzyme)
MTAFGAWFSAQQRQVLSQAVAIAQEQGCQLYAIGGIVRDWVTGRIQEPPRDLDLVVAEGDGVGMHLAVALAQRCAAAMGCRLVRHEKFQTAELLFPEFTLDLATARQEVYAHPGANPQVCPASLWQDLARRDFTVNALAITLNPAVLAGGDVEVLDRFGGLADLRSRMLRPLKPGSFAEDPRRIFRAVRFAVRLDLAIAPEAMAEIAATLSTGAFIGLGGSRLRAELIYCAQEPRAAAMVAQLADLGALACFHPHLGLPADFAPGVRRLRRWQRYFAPEQSIGDSIALWVLAGLPLADLDSAPALQRDLPPQWLQALRDFHHLAATLPPSIPSQRVLWLQRYSLPTLLLAGQVSRLRPGIWRYLARDRHGASPLTGDDLIALGYPRGKALGAALWHLRAAVLDGIVPPGDRPAAIQFLQTHPPA